MRESDSALAEIDQKPIERTVERPAVAEDAGLRTSLGSSPSQKRRRPHADSPSAAGADNRQTHPDEAAPEVSGEGVDTHVTMPRTRLGGSGSGGVRRPVGNRFRKSERAVGEFAVEVDRWTRERQVSANDVRTFVQTLNAVPPPRRKEALHRALNLIPDANVALLEGVLVDKSQPEEIVREVFNDIVNRPEEVKEPILKEIAKDKTHPCCSDAEWIFEVTGEKPE